MNSYDQYNSSEWQAFIADLQRKEAILLHKKAAGNLDADEEVQLEEIQGILLNTTLAEVFPLIDTELGWQAIRSRMSVPVTTVRLNPMRRYLVYAASVALVIGLGWLVLKQNRISDKNPVVQQDVDKHKATLILENGTAIALDHKTKQKITDGTAVLSDSARAISYQAARAAANVYHTLVVPRGGEYKLLMSDGTEVWLNSETRLRYPATLNETGERMVYLESGEAYFKVTKNKHAPFMVNLNGMQVEVLGTSFNINSFNQKISTTLVEGSIRVNRKGKPPVLQVPGEQSNFDPLTGGITKSEVDIYPFTSWKDGWLVFNDNSIGEVMEQVGRWYDYRISFESQELKALRFGGKLRKSKKITDVLNVIERSNELKCSISGQTIYIQHKN
ncbi:transmembrane sensor [Pedobacter africanus]|uniref:Ferric-dicitrate binding protein FerR (Iron transport regulator) n=1 Tax=Pedobacter africanus TaxID=151894 RepID=A0ACC6KU90_9SPHI|nr:FecR domain-containing protein [Pedobacter africanus]MDR6782765.1 ferric-dicitrate binding protein FerR (iron transport regulator) [Pedobacter africanus]